MARRRSTLTVWTAVLLVLLGAFAGVLPARAQSAGSNPNHMCGDGEFTVSLPGLPREKLGIDDSASLFQQIVFPDKAKDDSITLPKGCRIYAFFISGFGDNADYDHIIFYQVAEFVAQNNGYVHVGWWNNLTAPYMERPLHNDPITVTRFLFPDLVIFPTPRTDGLPGVGGFLDGLVDIPKANPDDDYQFLEDARKVLRAVRDNNPDAVIIVAGHSMGANSIARLGAMPSVPIDLLAPIDPVGNRDTPRGSGLKFNWTRWRATHDFKGWKVRDCVREGGSCKNFGNFIFRSYKCTTIGDWLPEPPPLFQGSNAPFICPGHYEDPGPRLTLGANVKHLYHRWQHESYWPVDFLRNELFLRPAANTIANNMDVQRPVERGPLVETLLTPNDRDKTCSDGFDARLPIPCGGGDGHGEIVGFRDPGLFSGRLALGLQLTD